ncbi:hypothetical protein [Herbaspirillum rubrisubalbicans]|uniref:Uncharacterized protein n=1 Tax=Herbaspirillum rubrisubalbicans TaxID=80842 RepID=A0AAD0UDD7_9BURK|nr:hypothetical protein [Herbaspirillum rubrisubalbicans]AYR24834.1 hypothetical protein RC54_13805 [Herbaspirillum rubrisubalbicans]
MSIPIDIPGGQQLGELTRRGLQPGVQQSAEGGFRGIVLIGASSEEGAATHVCEPLRPTSELAYADALAFIAAQAS